MANDQTIKNYSDTDLAGTHRFLKPAHDRKGALIDADFKTLMEDGYVIIKNLIDEARCDAIKAGGLALLNQKGRNPFEGHKTQRVYDVLSKTRLTDDLADHPRILGLMDKLFSPNYLLSQSQMINILPQEAPQTLHYDDGFYKIARPRPALGAATVWAIDDFTAQNGATVIIPKSHMWDDKQMPNPEDAISAVMPRGSVIFFLGTTWHGGGTNQSDQPRFAVTHQYCEGFLRQQENYLLELSKQTALALSPELKSLVGYSIFPPFMGMVSGKHPLRTLSDK